MTGTELLDYRHRTAAGIARGKGAGKGPGAAVTMLYNHKEKRVGIEMWGMAASCSLTSHNKKAKLGRQPARVVQEQLCVKWADSIIEAYALPWYHSLKYESSEHDPYRQGNPEGRRQGLRGLLPKQRG